MNSLRGVGAQLGSSAAASSGDWKKRALTASWSPGNWSDSSLFQSVGEGIVSDVVEESGIGDELGSGLHPSGPEPPALPQEAERGPCEVIDPERMVEPGVRCPRVDQMCEPQLPYVSKPLVLRGVDDAHGHRDRV
jgi:hypothetical protein